MKKYFDFIISSSGRKVTTGSVSVLIYGTATPASLFSDAAGTVPIANPVPIDSRGYFEFYAADGRYSLTVNTPDFNPVTLTDIVLDDPAIWNEIDGVSSTELGYLNGVTSPIQTQLDAKALATGGTITNPTIVGGTISGADIGYTPAGAGAVATTVQAKLRESVSVKDFGAVGDGVTDDTVAIQAALDAADKVFAPAGIYRTGILYLNTDQEFFGDGASTILQTKADAEFNILATYAFSGGTSNPADNKKNIYVHDLQLDQRKRDLGHNGFKHAMTINATTDMVVERVVFYDFRGDGCYVGAGTSNGLDRKNINITFRDCVFDGLVKDVRNGISVIDCDGLLVDNCTFKNIGAPVSSQSVGAIDFEPNNPWNTYRNVRITNCLFDGVDGTNSSAITFWVGNQVGNEQNILNWQVSGNTFRKCYTGVSIDSLAKDSRSPSDVLIIQSNYFLDSVTLDINLGGAKNVKILNNTFELTTPGSTSYRGGIRLGVPASGHSLNAHDVIIDGNTFRGLRPQGGAVWFSGVRDAKVVNNTFNDISGIVCDFIAASSAGLNHCFDGITIANNVVNNALKYASSPVTTSYFLRGGTAINNGTTNNAFISATNSEVNNTLNDAVPRNPGGTLTVFKGEFLTAAPTAGSWNQGNIVWDSIPAAGAFAFATSASGTFGTFANAPTGSAINGSNVITGITDADTALRAGQWITLTGDATPKRITNVSYGRAASVAITAGGSGYVNGQTVVLIMSSSIRCTGTATVVGGAITAVTIVDGGTNWVTGNSVTIESATAPSGSGATGTITAQTDIYLSGNFGGTTGAVTFAWSAPTFVVG